jgi:hypothetical protein
VTEWILSEEVREIVRKADEYRTFSELMSQVEPPDEDEEIVGGPPWVDTSESARYLPPDAPWYHHVAIIEVLREKGPNSRSEDA